MPNINGGSQFEDGYDPQSWDEKNLPIDRKQKIIDLIKKTVSEAAHQARENAGYAGSMDDGGASEKNQKLMYWLDGIAYAKSGITNLYSSIVQDFERNEDPEYQEFLRLKEKFKDV